MWYKDMYYDVKNSMAFAVCHIGTCARDSTYYRQELGFSFWMIIIHPYSKKFVTCAFLPVNFISLILMSFHACCLVFIYHTLTPVRSLGWQFGVAVTCWSRSMQLLYIEPS